MPEPDGELLVELTVEGHQDEPWTRRAYADGAVWEHTNLRTWIEDGQVRQEHQPLRWEQVTTAPAQALEHIAQVVRDHDLLHMQSQQGAVIGVARRSSASTSTARSTRSGSTTSPSTSAGTRRARPGDSARGRDGRRSGNLSGA